MSSPKKRKSVVKTVAKEAAKIESKQGVTSKESDGRIAHMTSSLETMTNEEMELKYGAEHVIQLFIPVSICLLVVVVSVNTMPFYQETLSSNPLAPFKEDPQSASGGVVAGLLNALIMMGVIILLTIALIVLYVYRCKVIIFGWLLFSSVAILFLFTVIYMYQVLLKLQICLDLITAFLIAWNNGCMGIIAIYWNAPKIVQQCYLIFASAMVALDFILLLPHWTTWMLLAFLVVWDLVAVLCPGGPLRILVETAKERKEPILPGMIYSAVMNLEVSNKEAVNEKRSEVGTKQPKVMSGGKSVAEVQDKHESDDHAVAAKTSSIAHESGGVKLGLGDFIFYSILVGKASLQGDWNTTLACFVAILVGLSLTLMLLAIFKKALPALPISLIFAMIFLFATSVFVQPFADRLSNDQVFI